MNRPHLFAPEAPPSGGAAVLPRTEVRDLVSAEGQPYRIFIGWPEGDPPAGGWPLFVVLDGNSVFATVLETVRLQSQFAVRTKLRPAVVVGVGYPTGTPLDMRRRTLDYTPEAPVERIGLRFDGTPWPPSGGAAAFLRFLEWDLLPVIERDFAIDPGERSLFGHSFGGLFAAYALFRRPGLFRTTIAASPSLWWGEDILREDEAGFAARLAETETPLRLFVPVGALEESLAPGELPGSPRDHWLKRTRMVSNARDFAARMAALKPSHLTAEYEEIAGENHMNVLGPALTHSVRFALVEPSAPMAPFSALESPGR